MSILKNRVENVDYYCFLQLHKSLQRSANRLLKDKKKTELSC